MLWNIPARTSIITSNSAPEGAVLGVNDMRKVSYVRPMPPKGSGIHRYIFELYALDNLLDLPPNAKRITVETAIKAHTIEKATLTGLYGRQ
jgi:Raf kinase inhibitor-like YbhB/YbcL family protein